MATVPNMTEEVYLHSSLEGNPEFIDGRIVERGMPTYSHAAWQTAIGAWFLLHAREYGIRSATDLHVKAPWRRGWRVPDVTILDRRNPIEERVEKYTPIAVFEVLSPDDSENDLYDKLDDYVSLGIPEIWFVDPANGHFKQFAGREHPIQSLAAKAEFSFGPIQFPFSAIVDLLDN